jgi:hypothetical protein
MHFHILQCICGYDGLLRMVQIMMTTPTMKYICFWHFVHVHYSNYLAQGSSNMLLEALWILSTICHHKEALSVYF